MDRRIAARLTHGTPVTQLTLLGEGHGLRRAASIHRALVAELTLLPG